MHRPVFYPTSFPRGGTLAYLKRRVRWLNFEVWAWRIGVVCTAAWLYLS